MKFSLLIILVVYLAAVNYVVSKRVAREYEDDKLDYELVATLKNYSDRSDAPLDAPPPVQQLDRHKADIGYRLEEIQRKLLSRVRTQNQTRKDQDPSAISDVEQGDYKYDGAKKS